MEKKLFILMLLVLGLFACNNNKVFEQHQKIDNNTWNRFKSLKFNAKIEKAGNYDIFVAIRHANYYEYKNLNIDFAMYSTTGEDRIKPLQLMLRDEENNFVGKGAGDIWDFSFPVFENIALDDSANYRFEIDNVMPIYELPGIMEVGIIIEKTKKEDK